MSVASLSIADLEQRLTRLDSAAILVPPRILRRVIKRDRELGGIGMQVAHYKSYVIGRDALFTIANRNELRIAPDRELPDKVILLARPDESRLRKRSAEKILLAVWRLLFHARIHIAIAGRQLDKAAVQERICRIGPTAFNEVRSVLRQEHFLLPPGDDRTVYEEFAALFFELRYFNRRLLPRYFPGITDLDAVEQLLAEDVDAEALLRQLRPEGAPDAGTTSYIEPRLTFSALVTPTLSASKAQPRAERAAARGNDVWAAELYARSGQLLEARDAIKRLTTRLQTALHLPSHEMPIWLDGLMALLPAASARAWPVEARLLYDLQKVCTDSEKEVFAVDLVEWVVSLGRKPIKRPLPHNKFVHTVKHLRLALRRLVVAQLVEEQRPRLQRVIEDALHHAEKRLRDRFRLIVNGALDEADLKPSSYAEQLARDAVVEELLDRVVERGFLTMSDLRDALARNRLKLNDIRLGEWFYGDKLLRANRALAVRLDGVYRRGEIYMRWLQRLSSIFFGTAVGRLLVLFLILPVGVSFVALEGTHELVKIFGSLVLGHKHPVDGEGHRIHVPGWGQNPWALSIGAVIVLGLIHLPQFRRFVLYGLKLLGRVVRWLFSDLPGWFVNLAFVRRITQSRPYLFALQLVFKPLIYAVPIALILWLLNCPVVLMAGIAGGMFVFAEVLVNSRAGLRVEEACSDALVRGWHLLADDVLPGLVRLVLAFFRWIMEGVDRLIYTVDESLRFQTGDSSLKLVTKPVFGLVWFAITYVFRFALNLLVEPQINPIKHFPVVTVSHKLILPLAIPPSKGEASPLASLILAIFPVTTGKANAIAGSIVWGIPGIFGFLVWELKENWKLYRANQPATLGPKIIGHHGETMLRLMRPGFHSGTLPKLYAKLRRYDRRHQEVNSRKRREELHHVEEAVKSFAERNLLAVLEGSRFWPPERRLYVGEVHAATNQIRIEICCTPALGESTDPLNTTAARRAVPNALEIGFEEQSGWLIAGVSHIGFVATLPPEARAVFADALSGFYHNAGVDMVRDQVNLALSCSAPWIVNPEGLTILGTTQQTVDLEEESDLTNRILYRRHPVTWADWQATWQRDQDGKGHEPPLLPGVRLLPDGQQAASGPGIELTSRDGEAHAEPAAPAARQEPRPPVNSSAADHRP
jgi:hypothetical protein